MNTKYTIEKLNGTNYLVWATQVQLVLEAKGLWKYVESTNGDEASEQVASGAQHVTASASDVMDQDGKEARQAIAEIMLNIESNYVVAVLSKKTPREVWHTLKSMNESQAVATQTTLRRRLLSLKMDESQTVQEYANSITMIENELAASNYTLSQFDKKYALIEGLPSDYDTIRTILREQEKLTFAELVAKLEVRAEEIRIQKGTSPFGTDKGPKAFMSGVKQARKGRKPRCYHCGKLGHIKKDCYSNPKSANYRAGSDADSKDGKNKESADRVSLVMMTRSFVDDTSISGKWFADSCASQHICRERSFFKEVHKLSTPKTIDIAEEGTEMVAKYDGTVELRCIVEGRAMTITLKNVAYIPTVRANLLSIPLMQQAGMEIYIPPSCNTMLVKHKGKTVMRGTSRDHKITELEVVNATVQKNICFATPSGGRNKVNISLLHRRLAHVNCSTIVDMVKNNVVSGIKEANVQNVSYEICGECKLGKATAAPHKPSTTVTSAVGECVRLVRSHHLPMVAPGMF